MGEHLLCKEGVRGSSPLISTTDPSNGQEVWSLGVPSGVALTGRMAGDTVTRLRGETSEGPPRDRCDKPTLIGLLTTACDDGSCTSVSGHFADAVTDTVKCVDRTASAVRAGPSTSQRGERSTSECATLRIEEWKHRFRRGDSDATASCDGQHRASRVNVVGQATKSMRWMPWRQEPTKDVAGSEMLRGVASKR